MKDYKIASVGRIAYIAILAAVAVLFLFLIPKMVETVSTDKIVINQRPWSGKLDFWTEPGAHAQYFGSTTTYDKATQFWFGGVEDEKPHGNPIAVRFNDASNGKVYGSIKVTLPRDEEHLKRIQTDYGTMNKLMNELVSQTVVQVIYASGTLMSAYESVSERKNDFTNYINDQLRYGIYKTTIVNKQVKDQITGEMKTVAVASLIADENAPGGYQRSAISPFDRYGIEIGTAALSNIDYSDEVKAQIAQQQEANMLIQTSRAKSAAAQQEAIRAEEEGKASAARAKWEQEKVKAVEVTKAEQEYEVARLAALKANEVAKRVKAEGEAKAAANRALVAAGVDPVQRLQIEKETKIGVAQALSGLKLPTYVVAGGSNGSANAMDAIGLKMMTDLVDKLSK